MFARCVRCKKMWNVSPKQKIGKSGYWCPRCGGKHDETRLRAQDRVLKTGTDRLRWDGLQEHISD